PRALERGPARRGRHEWTTELGYRLDGRIDHLLLDEFQDTAPNQWQLLLPLAEEVLGDGTGERSFFCVGDVKQSIYGWRGGEPRLLQRMAERHPVLTPEPLVKSYRSSAVVLDTVNHVFSSIEEAGCFGDPDRSAARAAASEWVSDFAAHETARMDLVGEARLWEARPHDGAFEKKLDPALMLAVERVVELRSAHPLASIAILVRARSQIAKLRYLLGAEGVEASDEGGNPLTDALGVTWILALLHLGDHPGDGVAFLQLVRSPFAERYGVEPSMVGTDEGRERAAKASADVRKALLHRGYGAFVDEHARLLDGDAAAWDRRRLEQLVELALAYDERPGLRPVDFVDIVRETRVPDPTASSVKVMTIHASKGLEFDIVVLPELGKNILLTPSDFMDGRRSEVEPPSVATARPKKDVAKHHEQLGALYRSAQARSMIDALSALYVAITRAVHCVELIVPAPGKSKVPPLTHGTLVAEPLARRDEGRRDANPEGDGEAEQATLVWEHPSSSPSWSKSQRDGDAATVVEERPLRLSAGEPSAWTRVVEPTRTPRQMSVFDAEDDAGRLLGTLVHALFEDFHWSSDEPRDEAALRLILERAGAPEPLGQEALARYLSATKSDALAPIFEEPTGSYRLATERLFDVEVTESTREPRRWRGAMDRLLLGLDESGTRVVRAKIVDFKTDTTGDAAAILSRHRAQLEDYRRAASALFGLGPEDVECWIAWLPAVGKEALLEVEHSLDGE
ncbi:MAG: UvrD-helicase domain-containing protein, partial [Planctomycetota bacterium]